VFDSPPTLVPQSGHAFHSSFISAPQETQNAMPVEYIIDISIISISL